MALTEDAKNEIREAVRIVREDRTYAMLHGLANPPKADPPADPPTPPVPPGPTPPPADPPPTDPPTPPKRDAYWGELLTDD